MNRLWALPLLAAIGLGAAACEAEAPPASGCTVSGDCAADNVCVNSKCVDDPGGMTPLDGGTSADDFGVAPDAGFFPDVKNTDTGLHPDAAPIDGGVHPDAQPIDVGGFLDATPVDTGVHPDAEPLDTGAHPDAAALDTGAAPIAPDAAVFLDAEPSDGGGHADAAVLDTGVSPDAEPVDSGAHGDATPIDSGVTPDAGFGDAGFVDSGPPPPAQPGVYDYRRILVAGIPSNVNLTQIAIAPDDSVILVSAAYNTIYMIDRAAETSTLSVTLPRMSNESVRVESIVYAPGGSYVLISASSIHGQNNSTGRLFRAGPHLQGLQELTNLRRAGQNLQTIAINPASGAIRILGHPSQTTPSIIYLYEYDDATGTFSDVDATNTSAGCTDIAWAGDGFGGFGVAYVCGINGITLGVFDSTSVFVNGPGFGAASNTFRIDARPQADYALTIESGSTSKLSRFDQGVWTTGFSAVNFGHTGMHNLRFSDDGNRALVTGNFSSPVQRMKEYRHGFYSSGQITDVSIGNFNISPFLGRSGVLMNDAAWRPGQDCGYVVGGCNSPSCTRGYFIEFRVLNGRACD